MKIAVARHELERGLYAPGFRPGYCIERNCPGPHTFDWREKPGSVGNVHELTATHRVMGLEEALAADFRPNDAMAVSYLVRDPEGVWLDAFPRLTKPGLKWLEAQGYEVFLGTCWADVDNPGHGPWTIDAWQDFEDRWRDAPTLRTALAYPGRSGYRVVQPWSEPVPVARADATILAWLHQLEMDGIRPDNACKDWTRHFRLPGAWQGGRRYATGDVRDGRATPIPAPAPRARAPRSMRRPSSGPRAPSVTAVSVPVFAETLPEFWTPARVNPIARALGRESGSWHELFLVLAGALYSRGVTVGELPAVVQALSVATGTDSRPDDRVKAAQSTAVRIVAGEPVAGYTALRAQWPDVADALDVVTSSGVELRVLRQLGAVAPVGVSLAAARDVLAREFEAPFGVTVLEAPPGTGKTTAGVARAMRLPIYTERAPTGARMAWSVPDHRLGAEVFAAGDPERTARIFSPLAHKTDGQFTCIHHDAARALVNGGQSLEWEFCQGRGKTPCERAETCTARPGWEGPRNANLVVGPHALLGALDELAGVAGTLVVDEPGEVVIADTITLEALDTAARYLDAFVLRYRCAIEPALTALDRWVRELAPVDVATPLTAAILAGAEEPARVLDAARGAILADARSKAPPILWAQMAVARRNGALASMLGAASRVLDLLWRSLVAEVEPAVRVDAERRASLAYVDATYVKALKRTGPVLIIDANARLRTPAIERVLGFAPRVVSVHVVDQAPVARAIVASASATRANWFPRGVPDWDSGLLGAVRAALAWAAEAPCENVALFTWATLETAVQHTLDPKALDPIGAWAKAGLPRGALDAARSHLAPLLSGLPFKLHTGHYWNLRGSNAYADCDASITLGDPRPNLGAERDACDLLGLDPTARLDARAAAELDQAHGRLRTITREKPGRMLHIGAVLPAWAGLEVDVRRVATGRPKTVAAMTASDLRGLRQVTGLSQADMARALRCSTSAFKHYETGRAPIPSDVATAARALGVVGSETSISE